MRHLVVDEKDWSKKNYREGKDSARCMPIGYVVTRNKKKYKLFDKFICLVNVCPDCLSTNTFHARQQKLGDKFGNVWRFEKHITKDEALSKKWDICLHCGNEFLIEYFAFLRCKK